MNQRLARLRNLLLLLAGFATIVVVACWDNRHSMQHVLDVGYPALVQVTGAQQQRLAPFAMDGWRPRFVEQALSVDLKWDGKDGKVHEQKRVPVTEGFADTIVTGDQVRTAVLPARVVDDGSALPSINADAAARYTSLQAWLTGSAYFAFVGWAGFAGITFWQRYQARRPAAKDGPGGSAAVVGLSPRLTLFGLAAVVMGAVLVFRFWTPSDLADGAPEISADVSLAPAGPNAPRDPSKHNLLLSWADASGAVHHYGPVPVSAGYWDKISRDGALTIQKTRVRYSEGNPMSRPVLVDDPTEMPWKTNLGIATGIVLMAAGMASLLFAARNSRRSVRRR